MNTDKYYHNKKKYINYSVTSCIEIILNKGFMGKILNSKYK